MDTIQAVLTSQGTVSDSLSEASTLTAGVADAEQLQVTLSAQSPSISAAITTTDTLSAGMGESAGVGTVYTPHITDDGILTWTNDGNRANPAPANIKGPKGDTGPQGPVGPRGPAGKDGTDPILTMDIDELF